MLRKYENKFSNILDYPLHDDEKAIIIKLYEYPEIISEAAKQQSPAIIANYIYDLVKLYNQFYQTHPILNHDEKTVVDFRMTISKECGKIISSALWLLGIESPERM